MTGQPSRTVAAIRQVAGFGEAVTPDGDEPNRGLPDSVTNELAALAATFEDLDRAYRASATRAAHCSRLEQLEAASFARGVADDLKKLKAGVGRRLKATLGKHPIGPWVSQYKGLAGPTTARLIALIRDPRRFPGQICSEGHHSPAVYAEDTPCPWASDDGVCGEPLKTRRGSGVRSLRHYLGLHVVDGRSPRLRKGVQGDWNTKGRTLVLAPDGLADQIIKHRTEPYRSLYDETKARLERERGADITPESGSPAGPDGGRAGHSNDDEPGVGPAPQSSEGAESSRGNGYALGPLRPFQIHGIARKVAAKRFVDDLLLEWKRLVWEQASHD